MSLPAYPASGPGRRPPLIAALALSLLASACAQNGLETASLSLQDATKETAPTTPVTSLPLPPAAATPELAVSSETAAIIKEARSVRTSGDKAKALALLDKAPGADTDKAIITERGLLSLELGKIDQAETLLRKADDPKAPNWPVKSALGAALSAKGKQKEAQAELSKALELAPDHPAILNNLALSYALEGKHEEAEGILRRVATVADSGPKTQQNLALILGLNGKVEEARKVSESILPADAAKGNASYLEQLKKGSVKVSRADAPADVPPQATARALMDDDTGEPIMSLGTPN